MNVKCKEVAEGANSHRCNDDNLVIRIWLEENILLLQFYNFISSKQIWLFKWKSVEIYSFWRMFLLQWRLRDSVDLQGGLVRREEIS